LSSEHFSASYSDARAKFLAAARIAGAHFALHLHPLRGPAGEELATDVAWLGSEDAESVLVMISATHGVEGFCGSAVQSAWLAGGGADRRPERVAVVLIHAVNPHGFAWLRRVNEDNVDLNRNWIDFTQPVPVSTAYDELQETINPRDWTAETRSRTAAEFRTYADEHGDRELQAAVTGGQWSDPEGLFFGGRSPTWSRRTITSIFVQRLHRARNVMILDFHTGLGPFGVCERILPARPGDPSIARAAAWFGVGNVHPGDGASSSAAVRGDNLTGARRLLPNAEVTAMALEFGVSPLWTMLNAIRADCWLHTHGDLDSEQARTIKAELKAAFCSIDPIWQGMVLGQSLNICGQALTALSRQG
jgi:Protein of unknown function (DUF2817)